MTSALSKPLVAGAGNLAPGTFDYIDALRGIAILGVVAVHCSQVAPVSVPVFDMILKRGELGVQLFYVVSAVTLCLSFDSRRQEKRRLLSFYLRRYFRIAPMFYLGVVCYGFVIGLPQSSWVPHGLTWWFLLATLLFVSGFHPGTIHTVVPGGWSIAVEMTFYAILPFLASRVRTLASTVALFMISIAIFVLNVSLARRAGLLGEMIPSHIPWSFGFAGLAICLSRRRVPLLVNRMTTFVGRLSFSMYVTHFAVLSLCASVLRTLDWPRGFGILFTVVVACTVGVSWVCHVLVEKPGIAAGRELVRRLQAHVTSDGRAAAAALPLR
jgi:peptidoglycan/LPS O-acetylase OafA/YrhL